MPSKTLWPALAVALSLVAGQALAQASGSTSGSREMQRGVPGADVDVNRTGSSRDRGVPGVDVDVRTNRNAARADADTRTSGAAAAGATAERDASGQRAARADRN